MTIYGAFSVGIAGLQAQSNKIGIISDNIANQNTVGYKASATEFETLVSHFATAASYSPGGVMGAARQTVQSQGTVKASGSTTDIAISGNGFFPVSQTSAAGDKIVFTRAGSFSADKNGYYLNSGKFFLKAWTLDQNGNLPAALATDSVTASAAEAALVPVKISPTDGVSVPTDAISIRATLKSTETPTANNSVAVTSNLSATQLAAPSANISVVGNLKSSETAFSPAANYDPLVSIKNMASGSVAGNFTDKTTLIDNLGNSHNVNISYLKTAADTWAVEIYTQPATDVTTADGQIAHGSLTFNSDGTLASVSSSLSSPITAAWNNGGGSATIALNFGTVGKADGLKQTDTLYTELAYPSPDYSARSLTKSMASGGVTPHFSRTVSVIDNLGVTRNLTASFLKTDTNTWAVEFYTPLATDITTPTGGVPKQVAAGTITFTNNGTLGTVSASLLSPISVLWAGATDPTTTQFNFGTGGLADGMSQIGSSYTTTATTPTANYNPTLSAKNMASDSVQPNYERDVDVVDQLGVKHTLSIDFLKVANNTWAVEVYAKKAADVTTTDGQIAHGNLTFNGDGSLASISTSLSNPLPVSWTLGDPSAITIDWGTAGPPFGTVGAVVTGKTDGMSQVDSNYTVDQIVVNGSVVGKLSNVSINEEGFVTAIYDNSSVKKLYKIPLAVFHDANQLSQLTGNIFEENSEVGTPVYAQAGKGGAGAVQSGALELSNVEVASQLTDMIVAQRAYQSNTKVISTTDSMLDTITKMLG